MSSGSRGPSRAIASRKAVVCSGAMAKPMTRNIATNETKARVARASGSASLGHRNLEVGEECEQECFELLIGAIDLVDQQHRRVRRAQRRKHWPLDQKGLAIDVDGLVAGLADRQHLPRVVPFIERGGGVDALVALQAYQPAAKRCGDRLRRFGLADAGSAFEQQRLAERKAEIGRGRDALVGEVISRAQRLLQRLRAVDAGNVGANHHQRRACARAPPCALIARSTFSGVIGRSSMRTPTALKIALATAGKIGLAHISPGPLAPNGPSAAGRSSTAMSCGQTSPGPGIKYSTKSRGPWRGSG